MKVVVAASVLILLFGTRAAYAQANAHKLLFAKTPYAIPEEDQRVIFDLWNGGMTVPPSEPWLSVTADGTGLEAKDCGPIATQTEVVDLNEDGIAEVFVLAGNACTSGMTGSSIYLFAKDTEGRYRLHLGFPAAAWTKLETSNSGFPDLAFGGPGFCEAVWRWDGSTYNHHSTRETEPGGCDGVN